MDSDRRRLVLVLIALAIAIPLLVEGYTLVTLVVGHFGGDGTPTETTGGPTGTTSSSGVGVGDEVLGETDRNETITTATLSSGEESWTLTITVAVDNTGETPYEFRLGDVRTDGDRSVSGSATTGSIPPGERGVVTAQWNLPTGDRPEAVEVTAVEHRENESVTLVDREVELVSIPVQG
jgi:hypothetical protein